ncbi:CMGC/CDK/CDK7 protein kinase [Thecamonas trahens ATCC 50062]|uniref:CMGC/CDK/CDK7 protein kinase n=1 Tax=Thecamonas trahens ATCC 50062 TaxID=461836 RepID=A0A0L0DHT4_THETB|nr:CMGC/CDK/CDK7 protein kinase [Thecamonas trahens ATCC 50062]KNC51872.1 CMGC/CDK/CDK7 protein kinase [Thecamonas trahens ATCC 50062]|eukprot:XP_013755731.1 CMGC/CDK/CDK7 protein kinase [Thecamonas trahens ATCC 50062]
MDKYDKLSEAGKGQYGVVYRARRKEDGKTVAIKRINQGDAREGVNFSAVREIRLLQELRHPHVVSLQEVFVHRGGIHLVMDFCETDLEAIVRDPSLRLGTPEIKAYMKMTLEGLAAMHDTWVLHRDLKPENLLVSATEGVKIADFGMARMYGSPNRRMTHQVATRWWRAPELLFGARAYGAGVDMWAMGCIFAELYMRAPLFQGETDLDQLSCIFAILGTVNNAVWPGVSELPDFVEFEPSNGIALGKVVASAPADAVDLMVAMLAYNPASRISATEALQHPYFTNSPPPLPISELPLPESARTRAREAALGFDSDDEASGAIGMDTSAASSSTNGKRAVASPVVMAESPAKRAKGLAGGAIEGGDDGEDAGPVKKLMF